MTDKKINVEMLDRAFGLLADRMADANRAPLHMIVCGGSALLATGLFPRPTKDVDVVALKKPSGQLVSSRPLPEEIKPDIEAVSDALGLMKNWLNSGPADLFEMGLPDGFEERLTTHPYNSHLTVSYIGRIDQIHFKLYASVDRGGYHVDDLLELNPTDEELEAAAKWAMTHDVSPGFRLVLIDMLKKLNHELVADRI